jgi:hypothetical protein
VCRRHGIGSWGACELDGGRRDGESVKMGEDGPMQAGRG